jgi:hypothetical protein
MRAKAIKLNHGNTDIQAQEIIVIAKGPVRKTFLE